MNNRLSGAVIVIIILIFSSLSLFTMIPKHDEIVYHLPTLLLFQNSDIFYGIQSNGYYAANTPLPYIILAFVSKILHLEPNLFFGRFFGIIMASLTLFIALKFFSSIPIKDHFLLIICLLFYPYFIKPAFTFYLSIYGLLFFILTLFFLNKQNLRSVFFGGIFNSLAILSQQFYLMVPVWFFYTLLVEFKKGTDLKKILIKFFLFTVPLIFPVLLFLNWGGLTHQNFSHHSISFSLICITNVTAIFAIFGGLFFPFVLERIRMIKFKPIFLLFIIAFLLNIFASPQWHVVGGKGMISGYTFKVIQIVFGYIPAIAFILKFTLIFLGLLLLFLLYTISKECKFTNIYFILVIISIIGFMPIAILSERHLLHLVFLVFMLVFYNISNRKTKFLFLVYQIILGSTYFYHWVLTKTIV